MSAREISEPGRTRGRPWAYPGRRIPMRMVAVWGPPSRSHRRESRMRMAGRPRLTSHQAGHCTFPPDRAVDPIASGSNVLRDLSAYISQGRARCSTGDIHGYNVGSPDRQVDPAGHLHDSERYNPRQRARGNQRQAIGKETGASSASVGVCRAGGRCYATQAVISRHARRTAIGGQDQGRWRRASLLYRTTVTSAVAEETTERSPLRRHSSTRERPNLQSARRYRTTRPGKCRTRWHPSGSVEHRNDPQDTSWV